MQPKDGDVVLGGQQSPVSNRAFKLQGIEGLRSRLVNANSEQKVEFLPEALNYGSEGLILVVEALKDTSEQVKQAAFQLLRQQVTFLEQSLYEHIPLISAVGVDYGYLRYLLTTEQWEKANNETCKIILNIAQREESWLRKRDIERLPAEDLLTVDRLWTNYTSGHFGFCIQSQIWKDIVGKIGDGFGIGAFCNSVGWQIERNRRSQGQNFSIKRRDDIPYSLSAPAGHLPTIFNLGGGHLESHHWEDPQSDMGLGRDTYTSYEWTIDSFFGPDMVKCFLNRIQCCEETQN